MSWLWPILVLVVVAAAVIAIELRHRRRPDEVPMWGDDE